MSTSQSKPTVNIPVRISSATMTHPAQPPVQLPPLAGVTLPGKNESTSKPQPPKKITVVSHPLTEDQRRKIMWLAVAAGMILIVTGWGLIWRSGWQPSGDATIFTDLKKIFTNAAGSRPVAQPETSQEIRDLTNQVFPQFETQQ